MNNYITFMNTFPKEFLIFTTDSSVLIYSDLSHIRIKLFFTP